MPFTDPHSYTDLTQGRIAHISLRMAVDFPSRVLSIVATYLLEQPASGSFYLDTRDLHIERVHAGSADLSWELDQDDPIKGQRLHLQDLQSLAEFTIELSTSPQAKALQWLDPEQTAGGEHPFLFSQCQAIQARSIFPCQDSPCVRITFDAQVEVAKPLVATLAAAHTGTEDLGETRLYSFTMEQPTPAYLFAIAAGNLDFREFGPRTGVYAEPEVMEEAAWEFAENEQKVIEAEKLLGPYLWGRYDIVIMPPSFPFGAMENPRLTFVSPIFIVGDRSQTDLISHELAHAWTGNLVTNATWEDFWLNEGWTVYAESRITEALMGIEVARLLNIIRRLDMLEEMKRFGMDSDPTRLKYSQEGIDPDEVFSSIPYQKGFTFLLDVEQAVGRAAFDAFIKTYIETFSFQSLTTEGFIAFLKQELPQVVGQVDIDEWIYAPGFPADPPPLSSSLYDDVAARAAAYEEGILPTRDQVADWKPDQTRLFLYLLPQSIPPEHCRHIEQVFDFPNSRNYTVLNRFYLLCISSGYQEVLPGIERMAGSVGRSAIIRPIFHRMVAAEWARDLARPLFERYRQRHHPITVASVEHILSDAGL